MKAVLLKGPNQVVIEEVALPEISDDEVLVEVKYCGICGTDVHAISDCVLLPAGTYMGHEFSGVLTKVGKNVKGWRVGARVVVNPMYMCGECYGCRHGRQSICDHGFEHIIGAASGRKHSGAFAKLVRVSIPKWRLHHIPDNVSFEEGALVEPLACSLHAVRISALRVGDSAMVLGAGPIGLGVIIFLKHAGAGLIVTTETIEKRAILAKEFGADCVLNPLEVTNMNEKVLQLTKGRGVDVVFDCSGIPEVFQSATSFLRRGGQLLLVGMITREVPILPVNFSVNEWELRTSMCYYADEFPMVIDFLQRGVLPTSQIITSKIKLSDIIEKGFKLLRTTKGKDTEIKILVEPEG